mmetsp:Transcript_4119/g.6972  ORF Transcript_4119/g.6972 Transcript_4119/m.6972 type:complete len:238 (+) Transcript_4119:1680-2393(+)
MVEGKQHKLYSQYLCLLGKLFLDHKTLCFDVDPFQFFILTENNSRYNTKNIVGYFCREKSMNEDINLACIMVLPPYQRRGYGKFMICFSYFMSGQIDNRMCTPERPLSNMGALSYMSFWKDKIFDSLRTNKQFRKAHFDVSIREIGEYANIQLDDILLTLQSQDMIKYWKGTYLVKNVSQRFLDTYFRQKKRKEEQLIKDGVGLQLKFDPKYVIKAKMSLMKASKPKEVGAKKQREA